MLTACFRSYADLSLCARRQALTRDRDNQQRSTISQIEMVPGAPFFSRRLTVLRGAFIRVYGAPSTKRGTGAYKRQGNIARCRRAKIYCSGRRREAVRASRSRNRESRDVEGRRGKRCRSRDDREESANHYHKYYYSRYIETR